MIEREQRQDGELRGPTCDVTRRGQKHHSAKGLGGRLVILGVSVAAESSECGGRSNVKPPIPCSASLTCRLHPRSHDHCQLPRSPQGSGGRECLESRMRARTACWNLLRVKRCLNLPKGICPWIQSPDVNVSIIQLLESSGWDPNFTMHNLIAFLRSSCARKQCIS